MNHFVNGQSGAPVAEHATAITATPVAREVRRHHLYQHFHQYCDQVEFAMFHQMVQLCEVYKGGVLTLHELSNGGCYMAPPQDTPLRLVCEGNGFDSVLSADAAGIAACLMALSHLSFEIANKDIVTAFHQLRDFAAAHADAALILRAID